MGLLPRYAHFARRYKTKWRNLLRFATPTNFPACDDCTAYKDAFEDARDPLSKVVSHITAHQCVSVVILGFSVTKDPIDRFEISKQYKEHLESVSLDRQLEMHFQEPYISVYTHYVQVFVCKHMLESQNHIERYQCSTGCQSVI